MRVLLIANTDWYIFNFRKGFVAELERQGYHVFIATPAGPYATNLAQIASRWVEAPILRRNLNPLREFRLLWWLIKFLRTNRIDVVHAFTLKCVLQAAAAAKVLRLPVRIFAVAGLGSIFVGKGFVYGTLRWVLVQMLRFALSGDRTRIIFQNPSDRAIFERCGIGARGGFRLIPGSGVDVLRFRPRGTRATAVTSVLLPSRLIWEKGIAEFVSAARRLRKLHPEVKFLLAGSPDDGNPRSVPAATLEEWVATGAIQWLGHVDDMADLLDKVDIVVLPSYYGEGLPKCLIEAAACGLPIVTTDVPGCRDVVSHLVNGLLVPARDVDSLARAIESLIVNRGLCESLGRAARENAVQCFDERIVIHRTIAVYEELTPTSKAA